MQTSFGPFFEGASPSSVATVEGFVVGPGYRPVSAFIRLANCPDRARSGP